MILDELSPSDKEFVESLLKEIKEHTPWLYEGSIWKNESDYTNWLRSQFRSIWSKDYPVKNTYLDERVIHIPKLDENGNQVYYKTGKKKGQPITYQGFQCELTGKLIKKAKPKGQRHAPYNVDHIEAAGSCTTVKEALVYFLRLLTSPDNMQLIDTEIHKIITHYDKYRDQQGFTCFNDASAHKKMISIAKNAYEENKFLKSKGITPQGNSRRRRFQIYEYLKNNLDELDYVLDYK